jgi:signal transduction histidine kinase/CheY-like chemotaxis protein
VPIESDRQERFEARLLDDGEGLLAHPSLTAERVRLLAERSRDAVAGVLTGSVLVAIVLQAHASVGVIAVWLSTYAAVNAYRIWLSRQLLAGNRAMTADVLRLFLGFAIANGLWLAALSLGFFSSLPLESKLALTVLILLAVAGGVATYASYAPGYIAFVVLAIPPAAFQWARREDGSSAVIAVTLLIFGMMMIGFSRYLVSVFNRSVSIRFDREAVVEKLRAEQLLNEQQRRLAEEASAAKSTFLANASHDLRQPAQALALYTAVLQRSAVTPDQKELATSISQASRALGGLLNNLLDLSRLDAGAVRVNSEPIDLLRLINRLGTETRHVAGEHAVHVQFSCPPLVFASDQVLLERTLRNLLHNALKFTDIGTISLNVALSADGAQVLIDVADTGCGIAEEHHAHVFNEFFQVENVERDREKGLGLGLSIVSRLVRLLDGTVTLRSTPGSGSVFTLRLPNRPAVRASAADSSSDTGLKDHGLQSMAILVLDDDPMVRGALSSLLKDRGAMVDAVGGLTEALELAEHRMWRICLCDLRLRGQEDGLTAAIALRTVQPDLPLIFISGDTAPERIEEATKSGHLLLHKPVDPAHLVRSIQSLVGDGDVK